MRRITTFLLMACWVAMPLHLIAQVTQGQARDTVKLSRDSIIHMVRVKDSLLNMARRDSIALAHLLQDIEDQRDSLNDVIHRYESERKMDSAIRMSQYFRNREMNRLNRQNLKLVIPGIEEDSVRAAVSDIVGLVYDDTAFSPKPKVLKNSMDRLVSHLAHDSIHFRIINAQQDTVPFTLKRGRIDSTAFYVMNSNKDSARVFMRSLDKHTIYMWVGDDLMLQQLLKKDETPWNIPIRWQGPSKYRITGRTVPVQAAKPWNLGAEFNLMVNQAAFANWAKGGNSSIALTTDVKARANYAVGNIRWDNSFWLVYGVQKIELLNLRKSQDKIEIRSSLSHKAFKNFDYSIGASLLTQGFKGYSYPNDSVPVSTFMAPGTMQIDVGMVYRPNPKMMIKVSPVTGKFTAILDTVLIDQTKYGLKEGQKVRSELGAQVYIDHKTVLFKNINLSNQVILFTNYLYHPEKVDIDWRLSLDLKVNKFITTTIKTNLIYDDDMLIPLYEIQDGKKVLVGEGKRVQFMETLAVGFKFLL